MDRREKKKNPKNERKGCGREPTQCVNVYSLVYRQTSYNSIAIRIRVEE